MDILDEKVKGLHDFLCLYTVCQLWAWGLAETITGAVQNAHLSLQFLQHHQDVKHVDPRVAAEDADRSSTVLKKAPTGFCSSYRVTDITPFFAVGNAIA